MKRYAAVIGLFLLPQICVAQSAAAPLQVDDYLLDSANYTGKTITITGSAMCLSVQICMLYKSAPIALNMAVAFNPLGLGRENRKLLLSCNIYSAPCLVNITGVAGDGGIVSMFQANSITAASN